MQVNVSLTRIIPGTVNLLTSFAAPDHECGPYDTVVKAYVTLKLTLSLYWAAPADENNSFMASDGFDKRLGRAPNSAPISSLKQS